MDSITLLLNEMGRQADAASGEYRKPAQHARPHLPTAAARLLRAVDSRMFVDLAAWMAGYARVTTAFTDGSGKRVRYVVATPLYVEYVPPPVIESS
jgi:hypothetical protein